MKCSANQSEDALAAYFLSSCSDEEARQISAHLRYCTSCSDRMDSWQLVEENLLTSVPQMRAPSELKKKIMAQVLTDVAAAKVVKKNTRQQKRTVYLNSWWHVSQWPTGIQLVGGIATACIIAAVVALTVGGSRKDQFIQAQGSALAPHAMASIDFNGSPSDVRFSHMPQAGTGRTYELWLQKGNRQPVPAGKLFEVSSSGKAQVRLSKSEETYDHILVTSEPLGGSLHPTRPVTIEMQL